MRKFADLIKEGYKGQDASLEISLFEQGLIWKEDEKDITFIYGVSNEEDEYGDFPYAKFDWGTVEKNVNLKEEWNWADWEAMYSFVGMTEEEFFVRPLTCIVIDLVSYYGYLNVFGDSYYPFEIEQED